VSRDNFFVLTPPLFEACSGRLELRHCAQPRIDETKRTRARSSDHTALCARKRGIGRAVGRRRWLVIRLRTSRPHPS
jgi:hypothetical protein